MTINEEWVAAGRPTPKSNWLHARLAEMKRKHEDDILKCAEIAMEADTNHEARDKILSEFGLESKIWTNQP